MDQGKLTVLYDNRPGPEGLKTGWGFSCLVQGWEKTILFDTGGEGPALLANMAGLGIDPKCVDAVLLSHDHWDHTGGLPAFLDARGPVAVHAGTSFSQEFFTVAKRHGAEAVVVDEPVEICQGVSSTGEMKGIGGPHEQALVLKTTQGPVVVTGCAHPGIVQVVARVKELTNQDVELVLGGFHLFKENPKTIRDVLTQLKDLGVRRAAPCHCSGDEAIRLCSEVFGSNCVPCCTGTVLPL
jgi:7,8-dihydropterin-6-yl-methyl-4-(beta-D-ribofuranosyl)aminobenzene 5'-phosphate synthase